jgi:hypothetical protein
MDNARAKATGRSGRQVIIGFNNRGAPRILIIICYYVSRSGQTVAQRAEKRNFLMTTAAIQHGWLMKTERARAKLLLCPNLGGGAPPPYRTGGGMFARGYEISGLNSAGPTGLAAAGAAAAAGVCQLLMCNLVA